MSEVNAEMNEKLIKWGRELQAVRLPRWKELPDLDLYMDQVLTFLNQTLSFLKINPESDEEKLVTAAMINNYVKQKVISKPVKKRYQREHLAQLIVIVILKPVLSLNNIREGIQIQIDSCKNHIWTAYDLFCKQFERSLEHVVDITMGNDIDAHYMNSLPMYILGPHLAIFSVCCKLLTEKILALKNEEIMNSYDTQQTIGGEK